MPSLFLKRFIFYLSFLVVVCCLCLYSPPLCAGWKRRKPRGILAVCAWCKEWDSNGKLRGNEETEVEQASRGERSMTARKASEAVVQNRFVCLLADLRRHYTKAIGNVLEAFEGVLGDIGNIRIASRKEIRSRLAKEILHAVCNEKGCRQRQSQTQPTRMPLP